MNEDIYPEHNKLSKTGTLSDFSQMAGEALEFGPYTVCKLIEFEDVDRKEFSPVPINEFLGYAFDIDHSKLEYEKRKMLEKIRK